VCYGRQPPLDFTHKNAMDLMRREVELNIIIRRSFRVLTNQVSLKGFILAKKLALNSMKIVSCATN